MAIKNSWSSGEVLTAADITDTFGSKAPLALSINAQTGTSYTLAVADSGKVVTMTNAAASTVTIPTNASVAVPIGSSVEVVNLSTGVNTTVSAAGGVTFNGGPVVLSPGSSVTLVKIGTDAWMAQGQGSPGLVHIATTTFSAVSSVSVNNCFTTTYANYLVLLDMTASANAYLNVRMRASGSDNATTNYSYAITRYTYSSGTSYYSGAAGNVWQVGAGNTNAQTRWTLNFYSPQESATTSFTATTADDGAAGAGGGRFLATTQFDGFSAYPSTGNITGTVRCYAYRS